MQLQAGIAGTQARQDIAAQDAAALQVQAGITGMQARKDVAGMSEVDFNADQATAAATIQGGINGAQTRQNVAAQDAAATQVQGAITAKLARNEIAIQKARSEAAYQVQATMAGSQARDEFRRLFNGAASCIQSTITGKQARVLYKQYKEQYAAEASDKAAQIQAALFGRQQRQRLAEHRQRYSPEKQHWKGHGNYIEAPPFQPGVVNSFAADFQYRYDPDYAGAVHFEAGLLHSISRTLEDTVGYRDAKLMRGVALYSGDVVTNIDYNQAEDAFREAGSLRCPCSYVWLARLADEDAEVAQIHAREALKLGVVELAEDGDVMAQLCVGMLLYFGWGVEMDRDYAVTILRELPWELSCCTEGLYILGLAYYYGSGAAEDEAAAVYSLTKAASHGHAEATYMLGTLYQYGYGVQQNESIATKLMMQAALKGSRRAMEAAEMYEDEAEV